jgi:acyl-CoA thioester hydrolase
VLAPKLVSKRSRHRVRVAYQDTDQARVVHHATYFRFIEAARIEFWREHGFDYDRFEKETGLGLPVIEAKVRYRNAARFDDLLEVETWIGSATRASVWIEGVIRRVNANARATSDLLFESSVRLACISFDDSQLKKMPESFFKACLEPGYDV